MEALRLAQPLQLGSLWLKNRVIMTAMHHVYTPDGLITPRFRAYYFRRAEGGAAMITVGACRFDGYGARASTLKLDCDADLPAHRDFVAGMHQRDCKVALQLYHAGRYMRQSEILAQDQALAPSAVYTAFTRETARAMTENEMARTIRDWAAAAVRARAAGYDAVEISASAGYLITQFLSPAANIRTDAYGGTAENRMRFPLQVLSAVRQAVGPDYPILLRIGGNDLVPGGNGSQACIAFARAAAPYVNLFSVTGGWHESKTPQLTGEVPRGGLRHLARGIRQAVSLPVAMANRMGDPRTAEEALALGDCDLVALGRPLIADPDWPKKILSGSAHTVRPCVACNQGCLAGTFFDKPVRCLSNGLAGREWELSCTPAAEQKRILVVGGGPAGCTFAIWAARRGHTVTLWERSDALGGQVKLYAPLPVRREFGQLLAYWKTALAEAGVRVELEKSGAAGDVLAGGFDQVILATGRVYKPLPVEVLPGAPPVYTPTEFLQRSPVLGPRVAVIGGSFVGLEIARSLTMTGSLDPDRLFYLMRYGVESDETLHQMLRQTSRQVAVFEKGKLGAGYESGVAWTTLGDLNALGAELYKNTAVLRLDAGGVVTQDFTWPCDAVIIAAGTVYDDALESALARRLPVRRLGNAEQPGRVLDAVQRATELALTL